MISHSSNSGGAAAQPGSLPAPSLTLPRKRGQEACGQSSEREGPAQREGEGEAAARADSSDIHQGDWVERRLPAVRPAIRPAGPARSADRNLALAVPGVVGDRARLAGAGPTRFCCCCLAIGAVAMRGAGCTLNDIADRDYDGQVARTRLRPLPSGAVIGAQAVVFLLLQLAIGAAVLFSLNRTTILLGFAVLGLIAHLPVHEADHLLAAGFSRPQFQLGGADRLDRGHRRARLAVASAVRRRRVLDGRLRHDLCASGQGGRRPDRRQILGHCSWGANPSVALRVLRGGRAVCGRRPDRTPDSARCSGLDLALRRCSSLGRQPGCDSTIRPIASRKFRSNRLVGWLLLAGIVAGHLT